MQADHVLVLAVLLLAAVVASVRPVKLLNGQGNTGRQGDNRLLQLG